MRAVVKMAIQVGLMYSGSWIMSSVSRRNTSVVVWSLRDESVVFCTLLNLWTTDPLTTAVKAVHSPVAPGVFLQARPVVALSLVVQITLRSS